jgi:hypothetical protein
LYRGFCFKTKGALGESLAGSASKAPESSNATFLQALGGRPKKSATTNYVKLSFEPQNIPPSQRLKWILSFSDKYVKDQFPSITGKPLVQF